MVAGDVTDRNVRLLLAKVVAEEDVWFVWWAGLHAASEPANKLNMFVAGCC